MSSIGNAIYIDFVAVVADDVAAAAAVVAEFVVVSGVQEYYIALFEMFAGILLVPLADCKLSADEPAVAYVAVVEYRSYLVGEEIVAFEMKGAANKHYQVAFGYLNSSFGDPEVL